MRTLSPGCYGPISTTEYYLDAMLLNTFPHTNRQHVPALDPRTNPSRLQTSSNKKTDRTTTGCGAYPGLWRRSSARLCRASYCAWLRVRPADKCSVRAKQRHGSRARTSQDFSIMAASMFWPERWSTSSIATTIESWT